MVSFNSTPAAGYKTNTFQEIKSHSSILFNERVAILFYQLDLFSIDLHTYYDLNSLMKTRSVLIRIYNNMRTLISNNPTMRATLDIETKQEGTYLTDVIFDTIEKMVLYCQQEGWSQRRIYIIAMELNKLDMLLKNILQYYHYFLRPSYNQKPDIEIATERYKEIADKRTVEELRAIVGTRNRIDFDNLGSSRIDYAEEKEEEENTGVIGDLSLIDDEDKEEEESLYKGGFT
jgi:hypothetical protein